MIGIRSSGLTEGASKLALFADKMRVQFENQNCQSLAVRLHVALDLFHLLKSLFWFDINDCGMIEWQRVDV